jgi:hypothetical protein
MTGHDEKPNHFHRLCPLRRHALALRTRFVRAMARLALFRFHFSLCCGARCDSNAIAKHKSGASLTFAVNFSFTNQRADSFLRSGVNLEAKV